MSKNKVNNSIKIINDKFLPLISADELVTKKAILFLGNLDGQFFNMDENGEYTLLNIIEKKFEISLAMIERLQNKDLVTVFWLNTDVTRKFKRFIYNSFISGNTPVKSRTDKTQIVEAYQFGNNNRVLVIKNLDGTIEDIRMRNVFFLSDKNDAVFDWNNLDHYADVVFERTPNLMAMTENQLYRRFGSTDRKIIIIQKQTEEIFTKLMYNKKGGLNMKFDKVIMNPPYDGNLHLKVVETILNKSADCDIVNISPVKWLEDPLVAEKQSPYKGFLKTIKPKINDLKVIKSRDAQELFNIGYDGDLGIYTFNSSAIYNLEIKTDIADQCTNKISSKIKTMKHSIKDVDEEGKVSGWRCQINELKHNSGGTNLTTKGYSARTWGVQLVASTETGLAECVFKDGYNSDNIYWTETRSKNQFAKAEGAGFPHSIKFNSDQEALNFANSCNTNFYKNYIYLIKFDQHMPLAFLPYMEDYSHAWTDEDYCKFFELTPEESEFMCRTVDDYRVKDFINYEEI